jgi:Skp family chaperone for outer membrane proteins
MSHDSLLQLVRILTREAGWFKEQLATNATKNLQKTRDGLLRHVREIGKRNDLELIVATEKAIILKASVEDLQRG